LAALQNTVVAAVRLSLFFALAAINSAHVRFVVSVFLVSLALTTFAQGPALFTADYYLANPEAYVGKEVTMAVGSVKPLNEALRPDGMRELEASTYNQHHVGGKIMILAPPPVASSLMQQIGTNRSIRANPRVTFIHGIFSEEPGASGRYFLLVTK
jgi:hypothetical protein